jgi:NAD(P)-dependent dehydrogenase (short-subunit alcohol dehydrogenase family)
VARLEEVAARIRDGGGEALVLGTDVRKREDVDALVDGAVAQWGRLDVMVNNAGVGMLARVVQISDQDFLDLFRINVLGALYGMQAAARVMERGGTIVNVSSVVGKRAMPGNGAYCATKFALEALSESLRLEIAGRGIAVVVVQPGLTDTEFGEAVLRVEGGPTDRRDAKRQSAADAARELVDATARRQRDRVLTFPARAAVALQRISPSLADTIVRRVMRHRL